MSPIEKKRYLGDLNNRSDSYPLVPVIDRNK